ncbi:MAG TPA: NFACT RNA binding domain-containing protein [Eubacteriales bacterium]|nr:NFACT RNA binding domain-containing protein [Eubacteriales bacterium]
MALDGLSLNAVVRELTVLKGAKIEKAAQPDRDTLLFLLHAQNHTRLRLLICIHSENGRIQLTDINRESPASAPAFCMLLRKRLIGGRIESIEQCGLDRRAIISIASRDEMLDETHYKLVVELMGKHGNIFLLNRDDVIIDCIRRIGIGEDTIRPCLPGMKYAQPPIQDKLNPFTAEPAQLLSIPRDKLSSMLMGVSRFAALSMPDDARERCELFSELAHGVIRPHVVVNKSVLPFKPMCTASPCDTMSLAMDEFYHQADITANMRRLSSSVRGVLEHAAKRTRNKIADAKEILSDEAQYEIYKLFGELLTVNSYRISRGVETVNVENYYCDPPALISVKLDPRFGALENAGRYYKLYRKGKNAALYAKSQLEAYYSELAYLEGQLDSLDNCDCSADFAEIKDELVRFGYIRQVPSSPRVKSVQHSAPLQFTASDGTTVYVGKNNVQNDRLTRQSDSEYTWLHAKDIPGSHVIIASDSPSREALLYAARLAAGYSKARASSNVAVDYTKRRYVKKPSGARPGFVVYTHEHTLFVDPINDRTRKA